MQKANSPHCCLLVSPACKTWTPGPYLLLVHHWSPHILPHIPLLCNLRWVGNVLVNQSLGLRRVKPVVNLDLAIQIVPVNRLGEERKRLSPHNVQLVEELLVLVRLVSVQWRRLDVFSSGDHIHDLGADHSAGQIEVKLLRQAQTNEVLHIGGRLVEVHLLDLAIFRHDRMVLDGRTRFPELVEILGLVGMGVDGVSNGPVPFDQSDSVRELLLRVLEWGERATERAARQKDRIDEVVVREQQIGPEPRLVYPIEVAGAKVKVNDDFLDIEEEQIRPSINRVNVAGLLEVRQLFRFESARGAHSEACTDETLPGAMRHREKPENQLSHPSESS